MAKVKKDTKKVSSEIYCHKCGTKNGVGVKFCRECGTELHKGALLETSHEEEIKEVKIKEKPTSEKSGRVHWGLYVLVIVVIAIIGFFAYIYLHSTSSIVGPTNNTYKTTNNQCTASSQCPTGDYCSNFGACLKDYCGDGICTTQKQQSNSCPIDCGCPSGEILNKYTGTCQQSLVINSTAITNIVNNYLKQNNINGTITTIRDSYYGNQAVKEADVNCKTTQSKYPCSIIFYINSSGNIINVTKTD